MKDSPQLAGKGKGKKGSKKSVDVIDGPTTSKTAVEFSIEYARSGRATCRKCEEKIEKVHIYQK